MLHYLQTKLVSAKAEARDQVFALTTFIENGSQQGWKTGAVFVVN